MPSAAWAVLLVVAFAAAADKRMEDMTEEEIEQAEKLVGVAKCKACEEMVERVEKEMGGMEGVGGRMKEVRAIEVLEGVCEDTGGERLYCDQAMEELEDKLIKYFKKGKKKEKYGEKVCKSFCGWKSNIKDSLSDLNSNFVESIKEQELEKRRAQIREERAERAARLAARPFSERLYDEMLLLKSDLDGYWMLIFFGLLLVFVFMVAVQVWCILRSHGKKLDDLKRLRNEQAESKKKK